VSFRLEFRPQVSADTFAAAAWYDEQEPGLVQNLHWPCRNASANFYRILYCLGSAIRFEESDGFTRTASHTASFIGSVDKRFS